MRVAGGLRLKSELTMTTVGAHQPSRLALSLSDSLFLAMIVLLFFSGPDGWSRLLLDGDTGWHIRTGEWILANGAVPRGDLFSFTKPGEPWFAWEWLADVIYALLYGWMGLKGVALLGGIQIALFATLLVRFMVWRRANLLVALGVGLLAVGASSIHYLARPHLFTMVLLVVALWMIEADRRRPGRAVWLLVPLTAVWTNLHGGFLALIALVGCLAAGSAAEAWLNSRSLAQARRYGLLAAACGAASLANPYGIELHRHVASFLRSDWIRAAIQEFQSPSFRNENILHYEVLLILGLMAAARSLSRGCIVDALWIIFWVHQSLGSVRHVTIYVTVAAPIIASELTELWNRWVGSGGPRSVRVILDRLAADRAPAFRRTGIWPWVAVIALVLVDKPVRWPRDFPAEKFPVAMVTRHGELIASSRVMTEDQWADYLIYRFYPRQRVYFDGRSDFYGPAIGREYIGLVNGRHDWERVLERRGFEVALLPQAWPLASLMKRHPGWRLLEDDGKALLFLRRDGAPPQTGNGLPPG
jgi:hypothetical protein